MVVRKLKKKKEENRIKYSVIIIFPSPARTKFGKGTIKWAPSVKQTKRKVS